MNYKHILSPLIRSQLPEHMVFDFDKFEGMDYSKFVSLIEHYYKWLEKEYEPTVNYFQTVLIDELKSTKIMDAEPNTGSVYSQLLKLQQYRDIDSTSYSLLKMFDAEYASSMPANLKTDRSKLIKNIRDFYQSKGSEKSFEFLFRVLFDSTIAIEYPRDNVLIASGGVWNVPHSVKIFAPLPGDPNSTTLEDISGMGGYILKGLTSNATTIVKSSKIITRSDRSYVELFIDMSELKGEFVGEESIAFVKEDGSFVTLESGSDLLTGTIISGIQSVDITDAGYGFYETQEIPIFDSLTDDRILKNNPRGKEASVVVDKLGKGSIEGLNILSGGSGYSKFDPVFLVKDYFDTYDFRIMEGYSADDLIGLRVVGNSSKATAVIREIDTVTNRVWFDNESPEINFDSDESEGRWFGGELVYTEGNEFTFRIVKVVRLEGYGVDILTIDVDDDGVVTGLSVIDGGNGFEYLPSAYIKSETVNEDGSVTIRGTGAKIELTSKSIGSAKILSLKNIGIGYKSSNLEHFYLPIEKLKVDFNVGVIQKYVGASSGGSNLSGMSRIHDGIYYQNYSYVVKTDIPSSEWRDIVKKLIHPAGTAMFSSVDIRMEAKMPFSFSVPEKTIGIKKHIDYRQVLTHGYQRYIKAGPIQDINRFEFIVGENKADPIFFPSGVGSTSGMSFDVNEEEQVAQNSDLNLELLEENASLEVSPNGLSFTKNVNNNPVTDDIDVEFSHTWPTLKADVGETKDSGYIEYYYQGRTMGGAKLLLEWTRKVFTTNITPKTRLYEANYQQYKIDYPAQPISYHLDMGIRFPDTTEENERGTIYGKTKAIFHKTIRESKVKSHNNIIPLSHITPRLHLDVSVDFSKESYYQLTSKGSAEGNILPVPSKTTWHSIVDSKVSGLSDNVLTYELESENVIENIESIITHNLVSKEKLDTSVYTIKATTSLPEVTEVKFDLHELSSDLHLTTKLQNDFEISVYAFSLLKPIVPKKIENSVKTSITVPVYSYDKNDLEVRIEPLVSFASHRRSENKYTVGINNRQRFINDFSRNIGRFMIDYLKYSTIAGYASTEVGGLNEQHVSLGVDDVKDVLFYTNDGESIGIRTGENILPFQTSNMTSEQNIPYQELNRLDNAGPAEEQYIGQGYEADGQVGIPLGDTFFINNNGVKEQTSFSYSMEADESLTSFGRRKQFPGQADFIDDISGDNNNTTIENFKTVSDEIWNENFGKKYMPDGYVRSFRI